MLLSLQQRTVIGLSFSVLDNLNVKKAGKSTLNRYFTYLGQMNKANLSFQSLRKNPCHWKGKCIFSSGRHHKLFQWVTKNILFLCFFFYFFNLNIALVLDNSNWWSTNLQILLLLMLAALPSKTRLTSQAGFQQTLLSLPLGWCESNNHMWV